jgi:transposase
MDLSIGGAMNTPSERVVIGMDPHKILVDRCRSLGEDHTRTASQLHQLLLGLISGGAKNDLPARQAKALLAKVRPRDAAGKTRRRVAAELIADLKRIHARKKTANKEFTELVAATGAALMNLPGIGPSGQIYRVVHIMARVQIRNPSEGRDYYARKKADAKAPMEAMRCVNRRLSDLVLQQMFNDATSHSGTGPGGNRETTLTPA